MALATRESNQRKSEEVDAGWDARVKSIFRTLVPPAQSTNPVSNYDMLGEKPSQSVKSTTVIAPCKLEMSSATDGGETVSVVIWRWLKKYAEITRKETTSQLKGIKINRFFKRREFFRDGWMDRLVYL